MHNDYNIKALHMFLKTNVNVKNHDGQIKWMGFSIEDDGLLEKYNTIWDKLSADLRKEFDNKPVYNKKNFENQNNISW